MGHSRTDYRQGHRAQVLLRAEPNWNSITSPWVGLCQREEVQPTHREPFVTSTKKELAR